MRFTENLMFTAPPKNALVAPVANYCLFGDEYKHNVVYSVGNVIDVDADDFTLTKYAT